MKIKFMKRTNTAVTPKRAHFNDAGFDLAADEKVIIESGETVVISTGISLSLPDGFFADVRCRSGLTSKTDLRVHIGTIDSDYRGVVGIICENVGSKYIEIKHGMKLAQLVIQKLPAVELVQANDLEDSVRGMNGFGSTGV